MLVCLLCGCTTTTNNNNLSDNTINEPNNDTSNDVNNNTNEIDSNASSECTHQWSDWIEKTKATCKTVGTTERICNLCHITESKETAKTNHQQSHWLIQKNATTTETGLKYIKCVFCELKLKEELIPILPQDHQHIGSIWVTTKNPSCTAEGSQQYRCSCGKILENSAIAPTGHNYQTTVVSPTPFVSGYTLHTCINCNDNYKDTYIEFENTPTPSLTYKSNGDGTCVVTGMSDKTVQYVLIPEKSPDGDTVVKIGNEAFKKLKTLLYVRMPDTISEIGSASFSGCVNLKTIIFPKRTNEPLKLVSSCFEFCGIEELILDQTYIETIPDRAFYGCPNLKTVKLNGVKSVEMLAFSCCHLLESVIHTGELNSIGDRSFEYCEKLTVFKGIHSQHNLDTITALGGSSFQYSGIRDIVFHKDLHSLNQSFYYCKDLGTVDCSQNSNLAIQFLGSKIGTIIFPADITRISSSAFQNVKMDILVIPDTVTTISSRGFYEAKINKIVFGAGITTIGTEAFSYAKTTYDFSRITEELTIEHKAFANNNFTSFYFPKTTVSIGSAVLEGCNKLEVLSIPFIGNTCNPLNSSTDCFGWLFGQSIDASEQNDVIPKSLKTLFIRGENLGYGDFFDVDITTLIIGKDITAIDACNFDFSCPLQRIYYEGTEEEWSNISINSRNSKLLSAEKYFYSANKPTVNGNYWHYDTYGNIVIW